MFKTIKKLLLLILTFYVPTLAFGQKVKKQEVVCSDVIAELSYYWKLDSLGNNGFRRYTYTKFLNCKIDRITKEKLLDNLGKPNRIWDERNGLEYVYHIFDSRAMPKSYDAPYSCKFISFALNRNGDLISIREGDIDL